MGMTIEHAKKLLAVIVASISEDDDCFTIEDENVQVFKSALLVLLEAVEAIPKADYENRLKADLVAMLTEIQLEIEELDSRAGYDGYGMPTFATDYVRITKVNEIIQQKINSLKEIKDGSNN